MRQERDRESFMKDNGEKEGKGEGRAERRKERVEEERGEETKNVSEIEGERERKETEGLTVCSGPHYL
jgi:hypothetical protein